MAESRARRLTCENLIAMLADYLEASLTPEAVAAFHRHLNSCPECVAYVNTYEKARELAGRGLEATMPPEMKARLRGLLLAELDPPPDG
jgi:anti-sigma factor RsiW